MASVEKVFNFNNMPDFLDMLFGVESDECDAFSEFLYCIHLLGDHIDFKESTFARGEHQIMPLAAMYGDSLISSMIRTFPLVFPHGNYTMLQLELEHMNMEICFILYDSQVNIEQYCDAAKKVKDILIRYVPDLLRDESYFQKAFYP